MNAALAHFIVVGLYVCLLAIITHTRKDDRFRCWLAAWLAVMCYFGTKISSLSSSVETPSEAAFSASLLALSAIFFVLSSMILSERRTAGFRIGLALSAPTLLVIWVGCISKVWLLTIAAIVLRQMLAIVISMRMRSNRSRFTLLVPPFLMLTGGAMLFGAYTHEAQLLISTLLFEVFVVGAVDFWWNGWRRSLGTRLLIAGLATWGATFPISYFAARFLTWFRIDHEIWNIPHYCVAAAIILMVMEEDTVRSNQRAEDYRLLFENHPHALWILDRESKRFCDANQAAFEMHGYSREEFLRLKLPDVLLPEQQQSSVQELRKSEPLSNRASLHLRKDGTSFPVDLAVHNINFRGRPCRFVMATDVSEREALEKKISDINGLDLLTGLPNRSRALRLIAETSEMAEQQDSKIAILSIDIDRFKRVNDTYGMEVADRYLQLLAARLSNIVRPIDVVARTGGDEFMVMLNGAKSLPAVEELIQRIRRTFAEPTSISGYSIAETISIGVVLYPDDGKNGATLWQDAELARVMAKKSGGNAVVWASRELKSTAEEQRTLEDYMRHRIIDGGFHLAYQPIYGTDGRIKSLEALLRLNHPELGFVGPDRFIPIAESSGLIVPLGDWVIDQVCEQLDQWRTSEIPLVPVAVNVSGKQLMQVEFESRLVEKLLRRQIDPHYVHLEVTESVALNHVNEVASRIQALIAMGFAFSIDDFGTGHSSFARLSQLGATTLKIDRSFMNPTCTRTAHDIVQAIITMAHALGHKVVAEGVETESQAQCLCHLGCDYLQGFLLSRPVSPDQIPALMRSTHTVLANFGRVEEFSPAVNS